MGKDKNVIIGIIYRHPDTDIKISNEYVSDLLDKIRSENKCVVCLSDYNISLLNSDCHWPSNFVITLLIIMMYLLELCIRASLIISR